MAVTKAKSGFKTTIEVLVVATWEKVGQVRDVSGPGITHGIIDGTHMESDGWEEAVATGLASGGNLTLSTFYTADDEHEARIADLIVGTKRSFRVRVAGSTTREITFEGIVESMTPNFPLRDAATREWSVKVTGEVTDGAIV